MCCVWQCCMRRQRATRNGMQRIMFYECDGRKQALLSYMCARCTKKTNKHPFQMYNLTPQKWESYNFGECHCKRCNTHGTTTMTAPTSSDSNNSVDSLTTMEIFSYFSMLNKMKWVNILEFCGRFNEQLKVALCFVQLVEHHDFLWNLCNYGDNNEITAKQPNKKMSTSEEWTSFKLLVQCGEHLVVHHFKFLNEFVAYTEK